MNAVGIVKKLESMKPNIDYELITYDAARQDGIYRGLNMAIFAIEAESNDDELNEIKKFYKRLGECNRIIVD